MDIKDFIPSQSEANRLSAIDELVDLGMSRPKAEDLANQFNSWLDTHFAPALNALQQVTDRYDRGFLQGSIVGFLSQWSENRLFTAAMAQQLCITAIIAKEQSNG